MKKCSCQCNCEKNSKKILTIIWQRLVSKGDTCPRCGSTEIELKKAITKLKEKGIKVIFKKIKLTLKEFKKDSIQSNRILLNGKLLEDLINAKTGQSPCCDVCGDKECRTIKIKGRSYEVVKADLIVKAGLKVVSNDKSNFCC